MPWSEAIIEQFSLVDRFSREEDEWLGPFNTLLHEFFPSSEHYQVIPQHTRVQESQELSFPFIIRKRGIPILFVEVNPYGSLRNLRARALADNQMREHFHEFCSSLRTPKLVGISSFGTQFCVYTFTTETRALRPKLIEADFDTINDIKISKAHLSGF